MPRRSKKSYAQLANAKAKKESNNNVNTIQNVAVVNTIQDVPVVNTIKDVSVENKIQDFPNVNTIKDVPDVNTIENDPVAITIEDDPVSNTIEDEPVSNTIKIDPVANTIQDIPVANTIKDVSLQEYTLSTSKQSAANYFHRDILGIKYIKQVRGNFHQGDEQFSLESRGAQCSCNALVMLCKVEMILHDLMSYHLDDILRNGDHLYKVTAQKLEACGQLAHDGFLENDQFPTSFALGQTEYAVDYHILRYGRFDEDPDSDIDTLDVELQAAFTVSPKNILIFGCSMMAIYKDITSDRYLFFDSHSRDESGFPVPDGTSFAKLFPDIYSLVIFLHVLADNLNLNPRNFGIQPLTVNITSEIQGNINENRRSSKYQQWSESNDTNISQSFPDVENEPGCSSSIDINDPTARLSRYQRWYNNLSQTRKNELLDKKRNTSRCKYNNQEEAQKKREYSRDQYVIPEKGEYKRQYSRDQYVIPEKGECKRQYSRDQYVIPEKGECKRQYSRDQYVIPEKGECKRQQSKQYSRDQYVIPEKGECKRQYSRDQYVIPEKGECKRQQSKQYSREQYVIPEKGECKRQYSRDQYVIPEKGECKRQYSRDQYVIPEKGERKRKHAKDNYNNPPKKRAKIQQARANRTHRNSDIDRVIKRFQNFSQIGQQLIYICEVCQRIFFKHQVSVLKRDRYNRDALMNALPSATIYDQLPSDENQNDCLKWICRTCHENIRKFTLPTLATINKLSLHEQPPELDKLNMLERHLISPAILFMKMLVLIKGSQKGIHGQVVCVKSDLNTVSQCLPRLPTDESLIRVKLKRRLEYKGHHMCQDINPAKISQALLWLKENNPEYDNIDIDFHHFNDMLNDQLIHSDETPDIASSVNTNHGNENQEHDNTPNVEYNNLLGDVEENTNAENDVSSDSDESTISVHRENISAHENDNEQDENDDITNTSAPLYSFLHPVDFAQYVADKHDSTILSLAPGEGSTPEKVLEMEAKCFPVEFPRGTNTYNENRDTKMSPSRYFNARLFSADNRFARNPEYIFFALYATEVHQIHSNISIAIRIGTSKTSDGRQITASMLRNREEVKHIIKRDEGYRFLTQIRGTPAFWEKSKRELFAMIRQLGVPTFFVTFSAADRRWIEIDNAILIQQGKPPMTTEEHKNMTWEQHCEHIMSNPVTAARMFEYRVQTFIKDVIMSKAKPIGEVEDYYYRTEFQQRGWPHIHMVVWVKDAPKLDEDNDDDVTEFVDNYITCEMPSEDDTELHEIVTHVQMHTKNHTKSCRKTGKVCRFNFPKPPSNRTFICRPNKYKAQDIDDEDTRLEALEKRKSDETEAKEILKIVWELLSDKDHDFEDFDQVLKAANVTHSKLEESLEIMSNRKIIYLKRGINDRWVNNYNPHLIRCWNGNMDIQYVLDAYACVMYIVSYITKAEREMGDLLKNAQKEAAEGNDDAVAQLRKLGSVYLQNREISVMGAIYLTCSMPLKKSTRKVVFIQTDRDSQKISLPLKTLQDNAGKTDQVWMPTQIDKYLARPKTEEYKHMCMAKFFSIHYQVSNISDTNDSDEEPVSSCEEESDNEMNNQSYDSTNHGHDAEIVQDSMNTSNRGHVIKLKGKIGRMKKRIRKPAIIRYPRISAKKDSERYHMNMLRLYLPHQSENIKPDKYETYQDYHINGYVTIKGKRVAVREIIKQNMEDFEPKTDNIDNAWEALQEAGDVDDAWAAIAPQNEQQRDDDTVREIPLDSDDDLAEVEIPDLQPRSTPNQSHLPRCRIEPRNPLMTEQQAHSMMRQLNYEQRQLFNFVSKWCNEKSTDIGLPPFRIFLTGGAGTGKSHVIRCIQYHAEATFRRMNNVTVDDATVLLVAQTGTAAFNISGQTICSALKIPPKATRDYRPLA